MPVRQREVQGDDDREEDRELKGIEQHRAFRLSGRAGLPVAMPGLDGVEHCNRPTAAHDSPVRRTAGSDVAGP